MKHFWLKEKKINLSLMIVFFVIFVCFILKGLYAVDPDFGWHLKMGEYILQKGFPRTDPFSYSMPSYPFVSHEWLTDITMLLIYKHVGIIGLSIFFATIALLSIWVLSISIPKAFISQIVLLVGLIYINFAGVRPQVLSWFCFATLLLILTWYEKYKYVKYIIPVYFLLWSNLHGSFPLGLLLLLLFFINKAFKSNVINKIDLLIMSLSVFVSFLPPYGWQKWWEIWMSLSDSQLKWRIGEWKPSFLSVDFAFLLFLALSLSLLIKYGLQSITYIKIMYGVLLVMAFGSIRHIPLLVCVAGFQVGEALHYLLGELSDKNKSLVKVATKFMWVITLFVCIVQVVIIIFSIPDVISYDYYPNKAVSFLKERQIQGNVLSTYNWGGYLIWNYPEKKVFIDGRMPSWRWKAPSKNESNNAFEEWGHINTGKIKLQDIQKKYNISTLLIPTERNMYLCEKPSKWSSNTKNIQKYMYENLTILYQDNVATIYSLN